MKKIAILISIFWVTAAAAQVKVGDNPTTINPNSILEVEATNKGVLLPRVALTATANTAPLTAHIAGMVVYNTATTGNVTPGFYYNDGTQWVQIAGASLEEQLGTDDQTLTGNRNVSLNGNDLTFTSSGQNAAADGLIIDRGFIDFNSVDGGNFSSIYGLNNGLALSPVAYNVSTSGGGANDPSIFLSETNDRVGIGTITPTVKLDVDGFVRVRDLASGAAADVVVTADPNGVLRQRTAAQIVAAGGGITSAADGSETRVNAGTRITVTGAGTTASPYVVNSVAESAAQTPSTAIAGNATRAAVPSTTVQGAINDLATAIVANEEQLGTDDQTLTGNRTVDLNGNNLIIDVADNGATQLQIDDRLFIGRNAGNNFESLLSSTADIVFITDNNNNNALGGEGFQWGSNATPVLGTSDPNYTQLMTLNEGTGGVPASLTLNGNARIQTIPAGAAADGIVTTDVNGNIRQRTAAQVVAAGGGITSAADGSETRVNAGTRITVTGAGTTASPYVVNSVAESAAQTPSTAIAGNATRAAVPSTTVQGAINDLATAIVANEEQLGTDDQTLTGNRNVSLNGNDLTFTSSGQNAAADGLYINRGFLDFNSVDGGDLSTIYGLNGGLALSPVSYANNQSGGGSDIPLVFLSGTNDLVGIGTTSPTQKLQVVGGNIEIDDADNGNGSSSRLRLVRRDSNGVFNGVSSIGTITTDNTTGLVLSGNGSAGNGGDDHLFVQQNTGRVGIGTIEPTSRFDVNGTVRVRNLGAGVAADAIVTADADGNLRVRTVSDVFNNELAGGTNTNDNHLGDFNQTLSAARTINLNGNNLNFNVADNGSSQLILDDNRLSFGRNAGDNNQALISSKANMVFLADNNNNDDGEGFEWGMDASITDGTGGADYNELMTLTETAAGPAVLAVDGIVQVVGGGAQTGVATATANQIEFAPASLNNNFKHVLRTSHSGATNSLNQLAFYLHNAAGGAGAGAEPTKVPLTLTAEGDNGSVGIGTTTPSATLSVQGNMNTGGIIEVSELGSGDRNAIIDFHAEDGVDRSFRIRRFPSSNGELWFQNTGTGNITFYTDFGTERLTISSSTNDGNVGIGTSNPSTKLDVNGTARIRSIPTGTVATTIGVDAIGNVLAAYEMDAGVSGNLSTGNSPAPPITTAVTDDSASDGANTLFVTDHVINFNRTFTSAPVVTVCFANLNSGGHGSLQKVSVLSATTTSFTIRVFDYDGSDNVKVNWQATLVR